VVARVFVVYSKWLLWCSIMFIVGLSNDYLRLITSKIKVCVYIIYVSALFNYFIYINTHTCMYI